MHKVYIGNKLMIVSRRCKYEDMITAYERDRSYASLVFMNLELFVMLTSPAVEHMPLHHIHLVWKLLSLMVEDYACGHVVLL